MGQEEISKTLNGRVGKEGNFWNINWGVGGERQIEGVKFLGENFSYSAAITYS